MTKRQALKISIIIAFVLVGFGSFAQQSKPKIGLVLAGGGAKGLAHIGVLKVLEEAGFDVEIVGGTSMGSIIGGLYAMGYDAKTLQEEVANIEWNLVLDQTPEPETQPLQSWETNSRYLLSLPFINGKPGLPSGINNGQKVYLLLAYLSENFQKTRDFKQLPREFFCIATDYYTGEEVLFETGYLPDAMRASSSIPSFFTPVKLDNRILIDGGWVNNFPVERIKERGAEYVIGVDFPIQEYDINAELSFLDIMGGSNSYANVRYNDLNRSLCDVLIVPELGNISSTDYNLADTIVKIGEATARKQLARLTFLADSLGIVQRQFANPLPVKSKNIVELEIEGLSNADKRIVSNSLDENYLGEQLPEEYLKTLEHVYGTGDFEKVAYRINYDSTRSGYVFTANMRAKTNPASLNTSINYNSDFGVQLLANYTHRNLFFPGYRLSADVIVSESPVIQIAYKSSFGPRLLPAAGVSYFSYSQPIYVEGIEFSRYVFNNLSAKVGVQSNLNVNTVLGVDVVYNNTHFSGDAFDFSGVEAIRTNYLNLEFYLSKSSLRDFYFPVKGTALSFTGTISSNLKDQQFFNPYLFYTLSFKQAIPVGKKVRLLYNLQSGSTLNRQLDGPNVFYLGGYGTKYPLNILPFFGYKRMELFTEGLNALGAEIHYNFYGKHFLKAIANAGYTMELTSSDPLSFNTNFIAGYGGGYAYNSPVGPMQIFLARNADVPTWNLYLYLGFWF